ncbi:MAG: hypothetical protein JO006_05540 [Paucibacter sp.]|nr:hypothetical protein [Roseateles sp.]
MRRVIVTVWCLLMAAGRAFALADAFIYPRPESDTDHRYEYEWKLLQTALDKTIVDYGPYTLGPSSQVMNQARLAGEIEAGSGRVSIFVRGTSAALEATLLPVRIPLDKGLLGYRVFIIRAADRERFAAIRSLDELRRLSAGQVNTWSDVQILRDGGFNVITGHHVGTVFKMLAAGRFDFFPRGPDEAYRDSDEWRDAVAGLVVEKTLLLHYPFARYFFVQRSPAGARMATRVELGLNRMLKDGSFDTLFMQYKGPLIAKADLRNRRVFELNNVALPPGAPTGRKELWFKPLPN